MAIRMMRQSFVIRADDEAKFHLAIRMANYISPSGWRTTPRHPDGELDGELHPAIHGWWARAPLALSAVDGLYIIAIRAIGIALTIKPVTDQGHSSTGLFPVHAGN